LNSDSIDNYEGGIEMTFEQLKNKFDVIPKPKDNNLSAMLKEKLGK